MVCCSFVRMAVRIFKVRDTSMGMLERFVYMVTLDIFFQPIEAYKQHVPHYGTVYKGITKRSYGYVEDIIEAADVVCDVTEQLARDHASRRIARYWQTYRERNRREKALHTLRPALMHWAYHPEGPLGKRVIASLKATKN